MGIMSLGMIKGLVDIAAKQKEPKLTDDMMVYADQIQKEFPEKLKGLNIKINYNEQLDDDGNAVGYKWDIEGSDGDKRKLATVIRDHLNEQGDSMYAPVEQQFSADDKENNEIMDEKNKLRGWTRETIGGKTVYAEGTKFNQNTRNIRILGGLRDDLHNWKDLEEDYKLDAISITGKLEANNYQHPWQFIYEPISGNKKAEGVKFTRVDPAFNDNKNQEAIDRLQEFIGFNFINDRFHNTQVYPTKPADYTKLEAYKPTDIDTPEKRKSVMITNGMPHVSFRYSPKEGYIINQVDPYERDQNKSYIGSTAKEVWRKYLEDN